jgi:hypothetical protein
MQLRPRRLATPVVLGVTVATLAALAASAHGFPVQHVSLNDGGIWVTDNSPGEVGVGRFAKPIGQLDGHLTPRSSTSVDVWQNGPLVATYASGASGGRIYAVNVDQTDFADPAGTAVSPVTPDTSGIAFGDDTIALIGADHTLRSATLGTGGGLDPLAMTAPKLAKGLPANSAVAVGTDDTIWVAGGGQLRQFAAGAAAPAVTTLPPAMRAADPMQVTTVGNVPVVADATARLLYVPGRQPVPLPSATGLELQQSSAASDVVVAATSTALYSVDLSTGALATLSGGESGAAAAPVQVADCVQAAWASGQDGSYVRACGTPPRTGSAPVPFPTGDDSPQLVFRVNNGEVVLNDTANGGVFLVNSKVTNVTPKWKQGTTGSNSSVVVQTEGKQQNNQLRVNPLTQGVRPGVTTEVHVLDAVKGDPAQTYAVTSVGSPDLPGVTVSIAPDAQTVLATVTSLTGDAHFQYTVDDGHGHRADGQVTLTPRTPGENSAPYLKQGYVPPPLSVASGGTLAVPILGNWRDGDGDPLYIDSGSVTPGAGSAAVTSGGALSFTAPHTAAGETVTLTYGVSDGRVARPTIVTLKVSVLGSSSVKFVAPVAEPDAAQAVVGATITLRPLTNDLPGVDPVNPRAQLRLAAPVSSPARAVVATDVADGTVSFTAQRAGDFFLTYTDAYGAAPTGKGTIRVYAVPASGKPQPPVTTPDVAVLHGQQPALVDVLADDSDPQGWLLGVTDATSATPGVHVTVIDQEWLRISADDPARGMAAIVRYTVSDGKGSATGTVSVSALPVDPGADQITTTSAAITVRAGDSAAVPVLAGDTSSTGLPVSLAGVPPEATPPVAGLIASAQGADIRIDAPATVKAEEETAVSYVATDADGTTAAGELDVTITPDPSKANPDQAPVPGEIDTREADGDVAIIQIPTSGADPDGDSVTVTGVTAPPALGQIVATGPDTISYQSYPGSAGTDTFTYQVTDPYGLTGTAQVRIAVLPPGPPQPPAAVDDVISAPPGASLHWNVLANDYITPGDTVTVEPLAKTNTTVPPGVRLAGPYVYLRAPASPQDPPVEFTYGATDGSTPSLAQVVVHAVAGAQIPPIANDDVAPLPAGGTHSVTVNVLKNDDDPVGSPSDLKISWAPAGVTVNGANLTISLTSYPREVPYQVTAPDGLTATAVVYVPGSQSATIRLKPGERIAVLKNGTVSVPLSSVLTDSTGRQPKITTTDNLAASPAGDLAVSADQETSFTLHALGGYTGPGAVTVQVYDGQTMQDKNGTIATVTIPVHVGSPVPVLNCPATPLQVVEGGAAQSYDIGQLCHVTVDTAFTQAAPHFTAAWAKAAGGVHASVPGGTSLLMSADSTATPGTTGSLTIIPVGATTGGTLNIEVIKAPPPTGRAASVTVKAGQSATVDLSQYVTSPLPQPEITVLSVARQPGSTATAAVTHNGSKVTVTPGTNAIGTLTLAATVSDEPGRADRAISVAITVTVLHVPGAPGTPTYTSSNGALFVSFTAAAANGAPLEHYTVYTGTVAHPCPAAPCKITGLSPGTPYTVYVTATNSVGTGPKSTRITAEFNATPHAVTGLNANATADGTVALTWNPAQVINGTPVTGYTVEISGGPPPNGGANQSVGKATSDTISGLANGTTYTFTVYATNAAGPGTALDVTKVPYAEPSAMAAPTAAGAAVPDPSATLGITVSWPAVTGAAANGSPVTEYTVYEYQATSSGGPFHEITADRRHLAADVTSTSFTENNDSSWYEFTVTATNARGESQPSPMSAPAIQAAAPPDAPTGVTAAATGASDTIQFSFTPQAANSAQVSSIEYGINGATASGTIAGPFTPGTLYPETLTNAMNPAIVDGTPVSVYVAECNDAGLCSSFSGPSAQVTPYAPIATPTVGASASGQAIAYTWSAQSDGLAETLNVCIAGACTSYAVPPTGGYSGSTSAGYGYSQTETITAHLTDTAGQSSATASASATTGPPPPPPPSVSVSEGSSTTKGSGSCAGITCYFFNVSVANFPAGTTLGYSCADGGGEYWPPGGGTTTVTKTGSTTTNGAGAANFETICLHANDGSTVTISVSGGGKSAAGSYHT